METIYLYLKRDGEFVKVTLSYVTDAEGNKIVTYVTRTYDVFADPDNIDPDNIELANGWAQTVEQVYDQQQDKLAVAAAVLASNAQKAREESRIPQAAEGRKLAAASLSERSTAMGAVLLALASGVGQSGWPQDAKDGLALLTKLAAYDAAVDEAAAKIAAKKELPDDYKSDKYWPKVI